ncbi:site-specific DNA-methyltransferase [Photobacterium sanguinicancri]|uniref:site-specific DNA-methyltransferase (adenine-specific) n=1 Tax=Photobacterium sanguinicancri TaxID=875932 RepID=A0ABX4FTA1_9GAMM|nr:site-specific DNA-methyltransferase [Photobacterium sanguinicancri]OZS42038.1 site-specific DNA-methyltransferase [Photobacterium sanguinicancri]
MNKNINKISQSLLLNIDTQTSLFESDRKVQPRSGPTDILYKGDNELVLRKLESCLKNSIDFCYIDPPYNTKSKFIYDDSRVSDNHITWGSHAEWMQFMTPRLVHLHSLLKDSGIVAISIDDYEQPYLRILLDQIFGESNFIACIAVCRSRNGKGSKDSIATNHEYIVVYGKSSKAKVVGFVESDLSSYDKEDEHGKYKVNGLFRKKGDASLREDRPNMYYPLYYDNDGNVFTENPDNLLKVSYPLDSKGIERRWLWGKEKATKESWKLTASKNGVIYVKNYHTADKRVKPRSLWVDNRYLTERATNQIKDIYGTKVFETPKPLELIEDLIISHTHKDALIIDFFAGTGTTAHAAFNLNQKDGGKRKVILVEQEQPIAKSHTAYKQGFRTISDITEFRLKWLEEKYNDFSFHSEVVS